MTRGNVYAKCLDLISEINSIKCAAKGRDDLELTSIEFDLLVTAGEELKAFCYQMESNARWD